MAMHSVQTLYVDGLVYQQTGSISSPGNATDTLQFISDEEGRVRWAYHVYTVGPPGYAYAYDFFERDHLGNTRMVLTLERDTTNYIATMEAAYRATESQLFGNIASTSYAWNSMPNEAANIPSSIRYPPGVTVNDSVSQVTGNVGQTTGPSLLLKVMAGDTITPGVQCYYVSNTLTTTNSSFNSVLTSLAGAIIGTPTGSAEATLSNLTSSSGTVYSGLTSFLSTKDSAAPSGYPKAYLNWILLDDQFNYVSSSSGSVAAANTAHPPNQMNPVAPGSPVVMSRNGYLYVWVSNETQGWSVFFDNFSVQYKQGPVLEENHYYPFGLTMAGISDKAVKTSYAENKYRYNGKELQHQEFSDGSGLEEYDYGARIYDPQIGRWTSIDPLVEKYPDWTPYAYCKDNPTRFFDFEGGDPTPVDYRNFFLNYAVSLYQEARDRGVSIKGALTLVAQIALESAYATNGGAKSFNNPYSLMENGKMIYFSDYSSSTKAFFANLAKHWPYAQETLSDPNFNADDLDRAYHTGSYETFGGPYMQKGKDQYDYGDKILNSLKSIGKRFFGELGKEISANDKIISNDQKSMANDWSQINDAILTGDWDTAKKASEDYNKNSKESSDTQSRNDMLKNIRSELQSL
jgi:RHS repeat-associated protein